MSFSLYYLKSVLNYMYLVNQISLFHIIYIQHRGICRSPLHISSCQVIIVRWCQMRKSPSQVHKTVTYDCPKHLGNSSSKALLIIFEKKPICRPFKHTEVLTRNELLFQLSEKLSLHPSSVNSRLPSKLYS